MISLTSNQPCRPAEEQLEITGALTTERKSRHTDTQLKGIMRNMRDARYLRLTQFFRFSVRLFSLSCLDLCLTCKRQPQSNLETFAAIHCYLISANTLL
jgi:hypothetical protein